MSAAVRPARAGDADVLYALACEAVGRSLDKQLFGVMLNTALASRQHHVAIAAEDGRPVGWGELDVSFSLAGEGLNATLLELYVRPECRGRGTGRALLIHLAGMARRMGCAGIFANCSRVNIRSREFLERNGFVMRKAQFEFKVKQAE